MRKILFCALMTIVAVGTVQARKLISWNIQDGMWSDQAILLRSQDNPS